MANKNWLFQNPLLLANQIQTIEIEIAKTKDPEIKASLQRTLEDAKEQQKKGAEALVMAVIVIFMTSLIFTIAML